jgi:hypothetical protein
MRSQSLISCCLIIAHDYLGDILTIFQVASKLETSIIGPQAIFYTTIANRIRKVFLPRKYGCFITILMSIGHIATYIVSNKLEHVEYDVTLAFFSILFLFLSSLLEVEDGDFDRSFFLCTRSRNHVAPAPVHITRNHVEIVITTQTHLESSIFVCKAGQNADHQEVDQLCKECECSICYEPMHKQSVLKVKCNHYFHDGCILRWLQTENKYHCPLCRTLLRY